MGTCETCGAEVPDEKLKDGKCENCASQPQEAQGQGEEQQSEDTTDAPQESGE